MLTGSRGLGVNGSGATSAPGITVSGSGDGRGRGRTSSNCADESLAAVARGIRPSAKSNTTHTHSETLPKTDFRSATEFTPGRWDDRRLPLHRCDALFRLITDAVGRRWRLAADNDQTAEMAATDWGVI